MAEDRGPQVAAVAILFLALSWVAVSLRCYVRTVIMKSFGADDWLAVTSLVSRTIHLSRRFGNSSHCTFRQLRPFEHYDFDGRWMDQTCTSSDGISPEAD